MGRPAPSRRPFPASLSKKGAALRILGTLRLAGFRTFFVGGSVRDICMGRRPKDYDILTEALPAAVKKLFPRTIEVGEKFGVIVVAVGSDNFEVATARKETGYSDARHPDSVSFATVEEDVSRRDFTVNGLLFDPVAGKVIDLTGGLKDIRRGIIRTIGSPDARFSEDALRMLRAIRFSCQLGFRIDPATFSAIGRNRRRISKISAERVRDELTKMIASGKFAYALRLIERSGLLPLILPEVAALRGVPQPKRFHPEGDVYKHTLLTIEKLKDPADVETALAALLHDTGKPGTMTREDRIRFNGHDLRGAAIAGEVLKRLRFKNEVVRRVTAIVANHMYFKEVKKMRVAKLKRLMLRETFRAELDLHRADCLASHGDIGNYRFLLRKEREFGGVPAAVPRLLTGHDLIASGYRPGPVFAEILNEVGNAALEGRLRSKEEALLFVRSRYPVPAAVKKEQCGS